MARIDLFTSAHCPACPRAREVVATVALRHPAIEVREWDLASNPGPAVGRGLFVTPAVLVNDWEILLGVPTQDELERLALADPGAARAPRILALASGPGGQEVAQSVGQLDRGWQVLHAGSVPEALRAARGRFAGAAVSCTSAATELRAWREFVGRASGPWSSLPLLLLASSPHAAASLRRRLPDWNVRNPALVLAQADLASTAGALRVQRFFQPQEARARAG